MVLSFNTDGVAPRERFDFWSDANVVTFAPMRSGPVAAHQEFWGRILAADLGPVRVSHLMAGAHVVRRSTRDIAAGDPELLSLGLQLGGTSILTRGERTAVLEAGDLTIYDSSHAYAYCSPGPFEHAVFQFPRRLFRLSPAMLGRVVALRVPASDPAAALAGPFLREVVTAIHHHDGVRVGPEDLGEAVLNLVRSIYAPWTRPPARTPLPASSAGAVVGPALERPLLTEIKAHIERHLDQAGLTPATIAAHHHVSLRYLYRLFEAEGVGVCEWIRARRLERCRQDLSDPSLRSTSTARIATRWGFGSPAHFSRVFRARYGLSPAAYRGAGQRDEQHAPGPAG
ncbi:MAG: helix-turn-helix domain-containing protein [Actinomycetota bacterium]|nr:helix-turn-helix domain-containing protein [Actinomycetota bacterium]